MLCMPDDDHAVPSGLILTVSNGANATIVSVAGEVDMATAEQLSQCLDGIDDRRIVVDLAQTSFLDSSGIAVLVATWNRVLEAGGEFRVRRPRDNVRTVLDVCRLSDWIE
jgi:anti-anti-sigma factor